MSFSSIHCNRSAQTSLLQCSWSLMRFLGTNFLHCQIFNHNQLYSLSTDIQSFQQQGTDYPAPEFSSFWHFQPILMLTNSTLFLPSDNHLYQPKTPAPNITSSQNTCFNSSKILVGFLPSVNKNFILILCSKYLLLISVTSYPNITSIKTQKLFTCYTVELR